VGARKLQVGGKFEEKSCGRIKEKKKELGSLEPEAKVMEKPLDREKSRNLRKGV